MKYIPRVALLLGIPALLFLVPWWLLVHSTVDGPLYWLGSAVFLLGFVFLPTGMLLGHGPRQSDAAVVVGDTLLGVAWVLFTWSVIGAVVRAGLAVAGVEDPARSRGVAVGVIAVCAALIGWGWWKRAGCRGCGPWR